MVVIGGPALAEHRIRARAVALVEERLAVHVDTSDRDAEVLLPLRGQVVAHGFVERVGVVRVGEILHLRPVGVPGLVLGLRGDGVELHVVVGAVVEIALEPLADHATCRLDAGRLLVADGVDQDRAVDRLAEGTAAGPAGVDAGKRP